MNTIGSDEILISVTRRELDIIRNALADYGGVWADRSEDELGAKDIEWQNQDREIRDAMLVKVHMALEHEHGLEQQREYDEYVKREGKPIGFPTSF